MSEIMDISVSGLDELIGQLERMKDAPQRTAIKALYDWSTGVMDEAKLLTPVAGDLEHGLAPGTLRESGEVLLLEDEVETGSIQVVLFFGGAAWAYAAKQHEDLEYHHTVGQAKFLEEPVINALPWLQELVGDQLVAELADSM